MMPGFDDDKITTSPLYITGDAHSDDFAKAGGYCHGRTSASITIFGDDDDEMMSAYGELKEKAK